MNPNPAFIDHTETQRLLDTSRPSVDKLIEAPMVALGPMPGGKKISRADVDALIARKGHRIPDSRPVLRCPQNPKLRGPSIFIAPTTPERIALIQETNHHLDETDRGGLKYSDATKDSLRFSGPWEATPDTVKRLVEERGIILGTVAGWVYDAGEVIALAMTTPHRNRKVFCVRPLQGDELTPWLGYLPDTARGPRLIIPGSK